MQYGDLIFMKEFTFFEVPSRTDRRKNIVGEISPILMGWPRLLGTGIQPPLTEMYMANKIYI